MISPHDYIKKGEPKYSVNSQGYNTVLHHVCATVHPDLVELFVTEGDTDVNFRNYHGQTPLHFAAIHQVYFKKEIIRILIENGADINIKDEGGYTALHTISDIFYLRRFQYPLPISLDLSIIECLLKYGADPNTLNKRQETPLMSAAKFGDLEIVKKLLDFGANVHLRNENLETCLHLASGSDRLSSGILEELVKHGACFYCFNRQGKAALDLILQSNKPDRLKNAKTLIKMASLIKWDRSIEFLFDEKSCRRSKLIPYCCECGKEIDRMKTVIYSENFTLCHFALRGYDAKQCHLTEESILSKVLVSLWKNKFTIYHGTIRRHFNIPYLHRKLSTHFYVRNEESKNNVFLNEDILRELFLYLEDKDLFNLAVAFANPPPSKCN
ncbi:hypothetical protein AVEN_102542-1 [Araneus ventricosus]|uniref:Uncharacterized protein n=1 Tax=Araneus ventricosus TaxID=182803 RepID=A0A4Y2BIA8_ARAVE|nr:hypothetical protein AVEN_102542-1 [Araneus ventricosus]